MWFFKPIEKKYKRFETTLVMPPDIHEKVLDVIIRKKAHEAVFAVDLGELKDVAEEVREEMV